MNIKVLWRLDKFLETKDLSLVIEAKGALNLDERWFFVIVTVRISIDGRIKLVFDSFFSHFLGFSLNHVLLSGCKLSGTIWVGSWLWDCTSISVSWEIATLGVMDIINSCSKNWLSESIEFCLSFFNVVFYAISICIVNFSWLIRLFPIADWLSTVNLDG